MLSSTLVFLQQNQKTLSNKIHITLQINSLIFYFTIRHPFTITSKFSLKLILTKFRRDCNESKYIYAEVLLYSVSLTVFMLYLSLHLLPSPRNCFILQNRHI